MPYSQNENVKFWQSELLLDKPLKHAIFTRKGGVSTGQWAELNVGMTVGDDPEKVIKNRQISFNALGRDIKTMSDSWLIHETGVFIYDRPRDPKSKFPPKADIILTDNPDVTLFMRYADCVPIILYHPKKQVVGLAHSGWKGTIKKVGQKAVEAMMERYGCKPKNISAVIGPSIGTARYEVGTEVIDAVKETFGERSGEFLLDYNGRTNFNLWDSNEYILRQAGVGYIDVSRICTAENNDMWFSHRADEGNTGRFGALIGLEK